MLVASACEFDLDSTRVDTVQAFVQSKLDYNKWGVHSAASRLRNSMSGSIVQLSRILYGLKRASCTWHYHVLRGMRCLSSEECEADARVIIIYRRRGCGVHGRRSPRTTIDDRFPSLDIVRHIVAVHDDNKLLSEEVWW